MSDASVVDQNVNRAICLVDRRDGLVDTLSLTHIYRHGGGLTTCLSDGLNGLFGVWEVNVRYCDLRAVRCELPGSCLADAGAGTGNEHGLSCEIHCGPLLDLGQLCHAVHVENHPGHMVRLVRGQILNS